MFDKLKQKSSGLFSGGEDRGVSPVIGVILMVAITVILAAVIGAFVLGLGDSVGSEAQAGVSVNEDSNSLSITLTSAGNSDHVEIRADSINDNQQIDRVGNSWSIEQDADNSDQLSTTLEQGTVISIVAVIEGDNTETVVQTYEVNNEYEVGGGT